jgi:hypothetical protein
MYNAAASCLIKAAFLTARIDTSSAKRNVHAGSFKRHNDHFFKILNMCIVAVLAAVIVIF